MPSDGAKDLGWSAVAKETTAGVFVYGIASIAAGILDLIWQDFEHAHQPIQAFGDHIPGREVLAFITAVWLIAGGSTILWRRTARAGSVALAAIYSIFAVFWLPRLYTAPHVLGVRIPVYIGVLGGMGTQLILVAAGAIVYASLSSPVSLLPERVSPAARWIFGVCSIDFGLAHLTGVKANSIFVPKWMPWGADFWTILTGICFVLAGLAVLVRILDVVAARLLALMLLVFSALVLSPEPFTSPHNHVAWGANAYNLAAVGAVWIFAESLANRRTKPAAHNSARLAEVS